MEKLFNASSPFAGMAFVLLGFLLRYLVIAGIAYLFFYQWRKNKNRFRIQLRPPEKKIIRLEVLYSLSTICIFTGVFVFIWLLQRKGFTQLYFTIDEKGWWWFAASVPLQLLVHDTWFYWTHRFMHLRRVFPLVHRVHHLSVNPTPWASFSFHPVEAIIEAGILPLLVIIMPLHPVALLLFLVAMTVMNVNGHLGYEIFPKGFTRKPFFRLANTSTHHNMHHRLTKCNYGLYLNIWDRIMGTNHPQYHDYFDEVKSRT